MAFGPLFFGLLLLLLLWLVLGSLGWVIATLRFRPAASFLAWGAALVAGLAGAVAPVLVGLRNLPGLLAGLVLALVCSTVAAWQTMLRITRAPSGADTQRASRPRKPR